MRQIGECGPEQRGRIQGACRGFLGQELLGHHRIQHLELFGFQLRLSMTVEPRRQFKALDELPFGDECMSRPRDHRVLCGTGLCGRGAGSEQEKDEEPDHGRADTLGAALFLEEKKKAAPEEPEPPSRASV